MDIAGRYKWLITMFEKAFGKGNVFYKEFDFGCGLGIGAKNKDRRHAVRVEFYDRIPCYDEDGEITSYGIGECHSLNKRKNKRTRAKEMIERIKEKLEGKGFKK